MRFRRSTVFFALGAFGSSILQVAVDQARVLYWFDPTELTSLNVLAAVAGIAPGVAVLTALLAMLFAAGQRIIRSQLTDFASGLSGALLVCLISLVQHAGISLLAMAAFSFCLPALAVVPRLRAPRAEAPHTSSRRMATLIVPSAAMSAGLVLIAAFPLQSCLFFNHSEARNLKDAAHRIEAFRARTGRLPNLQSPDDIKAMNVSGIALPHMTVRISGNYELSYIGFDGPLLVYFSNGQALTCES
jgi:hypothetical protein